MKKLLTITLALSFFSAAKSQLYVQGGLNLANISTTSSGSVSDNNMLVSFNAGFMARSKFSGAVAFESGLLLDGRGSKTQIGSGNTYYKVTFNPLYLEVPLNLIVRVPVSDDVNFFFNAGPYAAMGIAGKSKAEGSILGVSGSKTENIKFTNDGSDQDIQAFSELKRFDYGLNFGGGIDLKKVLIKLNYGYGLSKINASQTNDNEDDKNKYRIFSISLGIPIN